MATLAESLVSSSSRPLKLRTRPDLAVRQHRYHGRSYWVVKEPVGLNYFRFHDEEFAILQMLDGTTSMEQIKEQFEARFAPQKITYHDLQQFIGMLHRSGLVISEASGQGKELKRRRDEKKRRELWGKLANVLALRFRGVDPDRAFNWLIKYTGWLFSPVAMLGVLLLGLSALTLVFVQFDIFRTRLPTFHEFFGPHNWFYLAITMGAVKVLHEFGHGLSCKKFGGECHELGVMMLVFTPCLYCNVSDSWMLPDKWKRAFIGAAGMYVEVLIASIATYVWWFTTPGLLNQLCLSVMFICSVSTLLFNGNPLLRFDGYYILMDVLEIPNLRQKSTEILKRFLVWLCLGIEQPENPFLPQRYHFFFGLYTVAAVMYRWIVVFSILYFLNKVLEPYGLKPVGQTIAAIGFIGLIVQPLWQLGKFFYVPGRMHKVKQYRLVLSSLAVAAVLAFVLFVPLPNEVHCAFTVKPREAQPVFPRFTGQLQDVKVKPGDQVKKGDTLAELSNIELQITLASLEGDERRYEARLTALRRQANRQEGTDNLAGSEKQQMERLLASTRKELAELRDELSHQQIKAPTDGVVIAPDYRPAQKNEGRLPTWSGSPLETRNVGATVAETDLLCRIGDPRKKAAELIIDQGVVDFIKVGQKVEMKFDAFPHETVKGTVRKISDDTLQIVPPSLTKSGGGGIEVVTDPNTGAVRPVNPSYPALVVLDDQDERFQLGMKGQARISAEWLPLGMRFYRYVVRTFHFEW